jgi:hypothetical protein
MGFSDKIIAGKDAKIETLNKVIADWKYKYEDLECVYDNVENEKKARDAECIRRVEAHDLVVSQIHILNKTINSLERKNEEICKMNVELRTKHVEMDKKIDHLINVDLFERLQEITKLNEDNEELQLKAA